MNISSRLSSLEINALIDGYMLDEIFGTTSEVSFHLHMFAASVAEIIIEGLFEGFDSAEVDIIPVSAKNKINKKKGKKKK
jgi:hypothetical protein